MEKLEEQIYVGYEEMNVDELKGVYINKAKFLNSYLRRNFPVKKFGGKMPAKLEPINNIPKIRSKLITKLYELDRRIDAAKYARCSVRMVEEMCGVRGV